MSDFTPEAGIEKFFEIARERYSILLKRRAGLPKPWTNDVVLQSHRFCNVFREDDKTTTWFRENIRDPLNNTYQLSPAITLLAIVAFRWFNRIETWQTLIAVNESLEDIFFNWDSETIKGRITDHCYAPYVTGAYIIKTPDGKNKVDGVLWCIDEFRKLMDAGKFGDLIDERCSHEQAQKLLETSPYLGRFMAYQIIADARYTKLLENASDIMTWAQPGPGSTRGVGRIFYNDVEKYRYGSTIDERSVIKHMQELLTRSQNPAYWPSNYPKWEMQVVQNMACEVDKYIRCIEGGKMKRKYDARR